jgi:hypothetical protein
VFIFLNIYFYYLESLEATNPTSPESHYKSGMPELKRALKNFIIGIGLLSSAITVKNEFNKYKSETPDEKLARENEGRARVAEADASAAGATDDITYANLKLKQHYEVVTINKKQEAKTEGKISELQAQIKAIQDKADWSKQPNSIETELRLARLKRALAAEQVQHRRDQAAVDQSVKTTTSYYEEIHKEKDETKFYAKINQEEIEDEIKKSSMLGFDFSYL